MKGKILLINPPTDLDSRYGKLKDIAPSEFPMGLAFIAAYLDERGFDVEVLDSQVMDITHNLLRDKLSKNDYLLVGIAAVTSTFYNACAIADMIKKINPNIKTVVGGVHPSVLPSESLRNKNIDIVVRGEGEHIIYELANAIIEKKGLDGVKGISYKKNMKIAHNPDAGLINDLDTIPMPARHLFPMKEYKPQPDMVYRQPSFSMITSRGCPGRCIFCSARSVSGRGYRFNSAKRVIEEVELLIDRYGARQIIFWDDTFVANKKRINEICDEMIKRGINKKIVWFCESRVNQVDPILLKKMYKAGCRVISYGFETASQKSLDLIKKDIDIQQVEKVAKWTKKAKIECRATFMLGIPSETRKDALNTIRFAKRLGIDRAKFTIMTPYPGTEFYNSVKNELKSNWQEYNTLSGYTKFNPVYSPKGISPKELKNLQKRATREFYLRPIQIYRLIKCIRSFDQIKTYLKGAVALVSK